MGWWFRFTHDPDETIDEEIRAPTRYENAYKEYAKRKEEMTGWERILDLREKDEWGQDKPEVIRATNTVMISALVGAGIGGIGRSRISYVNFFRSNAHTAFETPLMARSKLQETVLMGLGSGAFRVGWRVGIFSAIYSYTSMCISAYRGKSSVLDPMCGGAVAGFLYKFKEGPRYMLAGTTIGGLFGLIGGGITALALALAGTTQDEVLAKSYEDIQLKKYKEYEKMVATRPAERAGRVPIPMTELHAAILESSDNLNQQTPPVEQSLSQIPDEKPSVNSVSGSTKSAT